MANLIHKWEVAVCFEETDEEPGGVGYSVFCDTLQAAETLKSETEKKRSDIECVVIEVWYDPDTGESRPYDDK